MFLVTREILSWNLQLLLELYKEQRVEMFINI